MYLPLVRISRRFLLPAFATWLLLAAGCYFPPDSGTVYAPEPPPAYAPQPDLPTALVIVVEGECTQEEYRMRRSEIVNYLIDRGYIASENDLVNDPADASRIIRAIVRNGGFTLSVFNQSRAPEPPPDLEYTDILYPADPYFIFGFGYICEIGPRHLPPRPHGYYPHPRPPHTPPPQDCHTYDHDRHWTRNGEPRHPDDRRPADRHHDDDHSHPGQKDHPPAPAPDKKPGDHPQPRPNDHGQPPPPAGPVKPADRPRLDDTRHPVVPPGTPKPEGHPRTNDNGHTTTPMDQIQSTGRGQQGLPSTPAKTTPDNTKPADTDKYQHGNPGTNYRPPAPASTKSTPTTPSTTTRSAPPPSPPPTRSSDKVDPPADDHRKSQN